MYSSFQMESVQQKIVFLAVTQVGEFGKLRQSIYIWRQNTKTATTPPKNTTAYYRNLIVNYKLHFKKSYFYFRFIVIINCNVSEISK